MERCQEDVADGCQRANGQSVQVKLIVTADDMGIAPERDEGIFEAFEHGVVTSASLLVNGYTAREAGRRPATRPLSICVVFVFLRSSR